MLKSVPYRLSKLPSNRRRLLDLLLTAVPDARWEGKGPGATQTCLVNLTEPVTPSGTVVLVHPISGTVGCYKHLAECLKSDASVVALQSPGLEETPRYRSIPDLASLYLLNLDMKACVRPLCVGGWSMGGLIAAEMARLMLLEGNSPKCVVMIDTALPDQKPRLKSMGSSRELIRYIKAMGGPLEARDIERLIQLLDFHELAIQEYQPAVLQVPTLLLTANGSASNMLPGGTMNWARYMPDLKVVNLPADHHSIVRYPVVEGVASWIKCILLERE